MDQQLDIEIEGLPPSLSEGFECTIDGKNFRYEAKVDKIEFYMISSIVCTITIRKLELANFLWWILWRQIWSFSESQVTIIDWNGNVSNSHRNSLITQAINQSVLPTDLLLNRLLSSIEQELLEQYDRIISLRRNQSGDTESGNEKVANGQ